MDLLLPLENLINFRHQRFCAVCTDCSFFNLITKTKKNNNRKVDSASKKLSPQGPQVPKLTNTMEDKFSKNHEDH